MQFCRAPMLAILACVAACSDPGTSDVPVRFSYASKQTPAELLKCPELSDFIEGRHLNHVGGRWGGLGKTFVKPDGTEKLSLSADLAGTVVMYRSVKAPAPGVVAAVKACGS